MPPFKPQSPLQPVVPSTDADWHDRREEGKEMLRTFEVKVTYDELSRMDFVVKAEYADDAVNQVKVLAREELIHRMGDFPTDRVFLGMASVSDIDYNKTLPEVSITF